jgi:hypothetical protein
MFYFVFYLFILISCSLTSSIALAMELSFSDHQKEIISCVNLYTDIPHRISTDKFNALEIEIMTHFKTKEYTSKCNDLLETMNRIRSERYSASRNLEESRNSAKIKLLKLNLNSISNNKNNSLISNQQQMISIPQPMYSEPSHTVSMRKEQEEKLSQRQKELISLTQRYETCPHRASLEKLATLKKEILQSFKTSFYRVSLLNSINCAQVDLCLLILAQDVQAPDIQKCITAVNCLSSLVFAQSDLPNNPVLQHLSQQLMGIELKSLALLQSDFSFSEKTFVEQSYLQTYHHLFTSSIVHNKLTAEFMMQKFLKNEYNPTENERIEWEKDINTFLTLCKKYLNKQNSPLEQFLKTFQTAYHEKKNPNDRKRNLLIELIKKNFINHTIPNLVKHLNTYSPERLSNLFEFIEKNIKTLYPSDSAEKTAIMLLSKQALKNYAKATQLKRHYFKTYTKAMNVFENCNQYTAEQQEASKIVLSIAEEINMLSLFEDLNSSFKKWKNSNEIMEF